MDRHFGQKGMWFALGVLALVFLCIVACLGAAAVFAPRQGGVWIQAPAGEAGAVPPTTVYRAHGGWGPLGIVGAGVGLLFKLAFLGLFALLLLGLVRRLFWGRWHACPPHWYGPSPQGKGEASEAGAGWRPPSWKWHAWRHHQYHHPWGPPPWWGPKPPAGPAPEGEAGEGEPDTPDSDYAGPME